MHSMTPCSDSTCLTTPMTPFRPSSREADNDRQHNAEAEQAADFVLDDCIFALGQAVGTRMTIDYDAVIWIRKHFHAKFLRAICTFGNRWADDRHNVTGAALMLGERAVRYAAHLPSISLAAIQQAAADVERCCRLHSRRAARTRAVDASTTDHRRIAGYWCI